MGRHGTPDTPDIAPPAAEAGPPPGGPTTPAGRVLVRHPRVGATNFKPPAMLAKRDKPKTAAPAAGNPFKKPPAAPKAPRPPVVTTPQAPVPENLSASPANLPAEAQDAAGRSRTGRDAAS